MCPLNGIHTEEVAGSKPASPTNKIKHVQNHISSHIARRARACVHAVAGVLEIKAAVTGLIQTTQNSL